MAATRAVLPTGQKVSTQSKSRAVLFLDYGDGAFIQKRSSNRNNLIAERRKRATARVFIVWTDGSGLVEEV